MTRQLEYDADTGETLDGESEDITGLQENIDAQLSEIFEQFGGDNADVQFKINIYRVQEGRGELGYCFSCVPSELPILDRIRDDYGPGKYEIRVYETTDRTRLKKRRKLVIEKMTKKAPVQNNTQELSAVLQAMAESQQRQMEQFKELILMQRPAAPQTAAPDNGQMLTQMIQSMAALQGLMPKPPENNSMDMFLKGVELMKDYAGDSGGGEKGLPDVLITMAKEFGGPLLDMTKQLSAISGPPANPAISAPAQTLNAPEPVKIAPPMTETPEDEGMFMFKMQLNSLVARATHNADPALWADVIMESMPPDQIKAFLGRPDLREFLMSINPEVQNVWPWFERLRDEVLAGLTESPSGDDTVSAAEPAPIVEAPELDAPVNDPETANANADNAPGDT